MKITNTTRQTLTFVAKDGGAIDIRPDETLADPAIDTQHAGFVGARLSGAILVGETGSTAPATSAQPQGWSEHE